MVMPTAASIPAPYFDRAAEAWVVGRYADVAAAFNEPSLCPLGKAGEHPARSVFRDLAATFGAQVEPLTQRIIESLPVDRPIDIVGEFAEPWCLAVATLVCRPEGAASDRLLQLAREISAAAAEPRDSALSDRATAAGEELARYFPHPPFPMVVPAFVALSQTLACFLANAWLALLRHPTEVATLRAQPELLANAIEELLRYAGPAHKISRRASAAVDLKGTRIAAGERVHLMVASANRDPEQFPDPDRLDLTRRACGQLSLGFGLHQCVAAPLIRAAAAAATAAFVAHFGAAEVTGRIEWRGGSGFRSPARLLITPRKARHAT
jgi:cytochrome P450